MPPDDLPTRPGAVSRNAHLPPVPGPLWGAFVLAIAAQQADPNCLQSEWVSDLTIMPMLSYQ